MSKPEAKVPTLGLGYMNGKHQGPEAPAFCRGCGRPMRLRHRMTGYDSRTGNVRFERLADCSASSLQRLGEFWVPHDRAVQDENGDWPWV